MKATIVTGTALLTTLGWGLAGGTDLFASSATAALLFVASLALWMRIPVLPRFVAEDVVLLAVLALVVLVQFRGAYDMTGGLPSAAGLVVAGWSVTLALVVVVAGIVDTLVHERRMRAEQRGA